MECNDCHSDVDRLYNYTWEANEYIIYCWEDGDNINQYTGFGWCRNCLLSYNWTEAVESWIRNKVEKV